MLHFTPNNSFFFYLKFVFTLFQVFVCIIFIVSFNLKILFLYWKHIHFFNCSICFLSQLKDNPYLLIEVFILLTYNIITDIWGFKSNMLLFDFCVFHLAYILYSLFCLLLDLLCILFCFLPLNYLDGYMFFGGFPGDSECKESSCNAGDLCSVPGLERSLGEGMATHYSILLAWKIPWTEEPGGL